MFVSRTRYNEYDYIIAGAGCAGLSLAMRIAEDPLLKDRRILIVDQSKKKDNDRTWCFWEAGDGFFEPIVYKRWKEAWFHGKDFSRLLSLSPYEYKLIRGIDFYDHCKQALQKRDNVEWVQGTVQDIWETDTGAMIKIDNYQIAASYVFSSILLGKPEVHKSDYYLLQHFKGWVVETDQPVFDPDKATLMDFRVSQDEGATFVYVMPFSTTKALIEYTLFSERLLKPDDYQALLRSYMQQFIPSSYRVCEEEFGIIPMTTYRFARDGKYIRYVGTAGGQTKASSGYTFQFIQKHAAAIVKGLALNGVPGADPQPARFNFYDRTLLHILQRKKIPGIRVFSDLFRKNTAPSIFRFLDNETQLPQELKIISTLPAWPFLKAAFSS